MDGRPKRRNKAAFSNLSCVVRSGPNFSFNLINQLVFIREVQAIGAFMLKPSTLHMKWQHR